LSRKISVDCPDQRTRQFESEGQPVLAELSYPYFRTFRIPHAA
jgi:hypothetical protein